jgi:hypothetical protein
VIGYPAGRSICIRLRVNKKMIYLISHFDDAIPNHIPFGIYMKFIPKSESTRHFILEATADLINKKGLAGTSLSDLENATRLSNGSIRLGQLYCF